jgi:hypothetical protein
VHPFWERSPFASIDGWLSDAHRSARAHRASTKLTQNRRSSSVCVRAMSAPNLFELLLIQLPRTVACEYRLSIHFEEYFHADSCSFAGCNRFGRCATHCGTQSLLAPMKLKRISGQLASAARFHRRQQVRRVCGAHGETAKRNGCRADIVLPLIVDKI